MKNIQIKDMFAPYSINSFLKNNFSFKKSVFDNLNSKNNVEYIYKCISRKIKELEIPIYAEDMNSRPCSKKKT